MPHIDESDLPKTPPREQRPVPKNSAAGKARTGLLPELDMDEFQPNQRLVEEALGLRSTEASNDDPFGMLDGLG